MIMTWMYAWYLLLSLVVTVWVAESLYHHGRYFLVETFLGNERLADATNQLLRVGFYLVNLAYVLMALKSGEHAGTFQQACEVLSFKVGLVTFVLGVWHFGNLFVCLRIRSYLCRKAARAKQTRPVDALEIVDFLE